MRGPPGVFLCRAGFCFLWGFGVFVGLGFFLKQSYHSSGFCCPKSLDNIHLAILHLFFTSCWYFRIILNTGNSSKCLRSLLKVQLAPIPQVIPLEGFPTSQEHPAEDSKTTQRHQFPHKAHPLVIRACQALKEEAPTSQKWAERNHNIFTTFPALDPSTGQGSGGSRQDSGKKSGPSFATITPAPLRAGGTG